MPRPIKFRAWDKDKKIMSEPFDLIDLAQGYDCGYNVDFPFDVVDKEIMQFTGLHDRNGKEIFKGDILELDYGQLDGRIDYAHVVWNDEGGYWDTTFIRSTTFSARESWMVSMLNNWLTSKIIGNIYESSDLLEKS